MAVSSEEIKRKFKTFQYSTYEEDKIEILNEIVQYSVVDPVTVGTFCLVGVFESIFEMDETEPQYQIIENVFRSKEREAFLEILFDDKKDVEMFFTLSNTEILYLINTFNTVILGDVLISKNRENVIKLIISLIKNDMFDIKNDLLMNIFNKVKDDISILNQVLDMKYSYEISNIIVEICKNNLINQNLLVNSKMYKNNIDKVSSNILSRVLNPFNKEYGKIQIELMNINVLNNLSSKKQWEIIYKLIYGNVNTLKTVDKHINIEEITVLADNDYWCACILEIYLNVKDIKKDGFILVILKNISGVECTCNKEIFTVESDINLHLCYLIFCSASLNEDLIIFIKEQFVTDSGNLTVFLSLILALMHQVDINITVYNTISYLKMFRKYLINNNCFSNKIDEILLDTVIHFIKHYDQSVIEMNIADYENVIVKYEENKNMINVVEMDVNEAREETGGLFDIDNLEKFGEGLQSVLRFFRK